MNLITLFKFLIGRHDAILNVARHPHATWIGLVFVLSAGFAREYDGKSLWHEPWYLAIPIGAALVSATILFALITLMMLSKFHQAPSLGRRYWAFLGLFFMTAPLAWLYAIPFERFLTPLAAVKSNLWVLALVAFWRVVLMTRIISVIANIHFLAAFFPVMLFADTAALAALFYTKVPMVDLMGGLPRLSESESLIAHTVFNIQILGMLTLLVWLFGTVVVFFKGKSIWFASESDPSIATPRISKGLIGLTFGSLAVWIIILPFTQPEQQLRYRVEYELNARRIQNAVKLMSDHSREDFPPHWDPPPRVAYGDDPLLLLDIVNAVTSKPVPNWMKSIYLEKFRHYLAGHYVRDAWEIAKIKLILERLPEARYWPRHLETQPSD